MKLHILAYTPIALLLCWRLSLPATGADLAVSQSVQPDRWQAIETKHTLVSYRNRKDLARFDRQLKYEPAVQGWKRLAPPPSAGTLPKRVSAKVDALFERVQEILGMRRQMKKPTIFLHANRDELHAAYRHIYKQPCAIRAWYQYRTNGVYLNVRDLHEGMLAHELAHAIIDHYLLVRPPEATAEILARYVDSHLKTPD